MFLRKANLANNSGTGIFGIRGECELFNRSCVNQRELTNESAASILYEAKPTTPRRAVHFLRSFVKARACTQPSYDGPTVISGLRMAWGAGQVPTAQRSLIGYIICCTKSMHRERLSLQDTHGQVVAEKDRSTKSPAGPCVITQ